MKEVEVLYDHEIVCEVCSHMFKRTNGDACLKTVPMPLDSDSTFAGGVAPKVKCGRFNGHDGPHVGCVMQPIGDKGGKVRGLWRRFHISWED